MSNSYDFFTFIGIQRTNTYTHHKHEQLLYIHTIGKCSNMPDISFFFKIIDKWNIGEKSQSEVLSLHFYNGNEHHHMTLSTIKIILEVVTD